MKTKSYSQTVNCLSLIPLLLALAIPSPAQDAATAMHVAELKATLAASQAVLKEYEWIQTTVVSVNDEQTSQKQERCYYGADGGMQKVELSESSADRGPKFGLRKRIAERKKEEMTDFMKNAVALVKSYVPPSSTKLQAAKDAGNVSLDVLDPGKRVRLNFTDYQKPGDKLGIEVDLTKNRPLAISVSSYVGDPSDSVTLHVSMGQLSDGTTYPATATLTAASKHLEVQVINSGYRKVN